MAHPSRHGFRVEKPFRAYRLVGTFPSDAAHGSPSTHVGCHEARNVVPGDEIHVLPGGTFHVERATGKTWILGLYPPSEPFERSASSEPDDIRLDRMAATPGMVTRVDVPETVPDRKAAGAAVIRHATPRRQVVEIDRSPEAEELLRALEPARRAFHRLARSGAVDSRGEPPTEMFSESIGQPYVRLAFRFGDYRPGGAGPEVATSILVEWCHVPRYALLHVPGGTEVPMTCGSATPADGGRSSYKMDLVTLAAFLPQIIAVHVRDRRVDMPDGSMAPPGPSAGRP